MVNSQWSTFNAGESAESILAKIVSGTPEVMVALERVRRIRGQMETYQAAALHTLVRAYDFAGASILEIGTLAGYSAAVMALAAPRAFIVTLNPKENEQAEALRNLKPYPNVRLIQRPSMDYLAFLQSHPFGCADGRGEMFNMVYVDGDHKRVRDDLAWWERLRPGGLMLFHDYSLEKCPPVFEAVNELAQTVGRAEPELVIMDEQGIGMAGVWKKGAGEQGSR